MISVYYESLICDCDGAEILRPQHFVVVCEHTSIHDDILSRVPPKGHRRFVESVKRSASNSVETLSDHLYTPN